MSSEAHAAPAGTSALLPAHQFDSLEQQREAATLGMWVFLVTEVMFFGGLFLGYTIFRTAYPDAFGEASTRLDLWLGAANTAVLIASSLTMALAVHAAALDRRGALLSCLGLTMLLGAAFLGVKAYEYHHKFEEQLVPGPRFVFPGASERGARVFFSLYFAMTGLHALHMVIGMGVLGVLAVLAARGRFAGGRHGPVEMAGLYWHFVDLVWIFLFPLLYLVKRHAAP